MFDALPIAFGLLFIAITALRSLALQFSTGKNPIVIDRKDPVLGFVGAVFSVVTVALLSYFAALAVYPEIEEFSGVLSWIPEPGRKIVATGLMAVALLWMGVAQFAMGSSWRIGIDKTETLPLRTAGPFNHSRNPIFLGMLGFVVGLTLWSPTALTLSALVAAYLSLEIQIRFEEQYLERVHGVAYGSYRAKVRRWL